MKNGEIPSHWEELVNSNSESVTDEKINLANTWAESLSSEMTENTPFEEDMNLQLTRSFDPSKLLNLHRMTRRKIFLMTLSKFPRETLL